MQVPEFGLDEEVTLHIAQFGLEVRPSDRIFPATQAPIFASASSFDIDDYSESYFHLSKTKFNAFKVNGGSHNLFSIYFSGTYGAIMAK